jgi:hypothetical protein
MLLGYAAIPGQPAGGYPAHAQGPMKGGGIAMPGICHAGGYPGMMAGGGAGAIIGYAAGMPQGHLLPGCSSWYGCPGTIPPGLHVVWVCRLSCCGHGVDLWQGWICVLSC